VTASLAAAAPAPVGRRRRWLPRWALALPAWVWNLGFFLVPLLVIILYSFGHAPPDVNKATSPIVLSPLSTSSYGVALDDTFRSVFTRTLRISVIGTLLCLVISLPLAYWLATKVSPRWRGLLLGLVIVPFWTSFLLRTFAWRIMLAPKGYLSQQLLSWHVVQYPLQLLDTKGAVQLGVVYNYLPLMIFPLYVAFERLDPALREAGKDLGAGRVRTFWTVTLPLAMPGVIAGLLLVFIPLCGDYVTATILGGARGTMVGTIVASQFLESQDWATGSAMAVILVGMIFAVIAVVALVGLAVRSAAHAVRRVQLPSPVTPVTRTSRTSAA